MQQLINNVAIIPYGVLRKKLKNPHHLIAKYQEENHEVWEIEFNCFISKILFGDTQNFDPKSKIAIWFMAKKKKYGLIPHSFYIIVNNRVFKRITYGDVGKKNARSGLKAIRDNKNIIYLEPLKFKKEDKKELMRSVNLNLAKG